MSDIKGKQKEQPTALVLYPDTENYTKEALVKAFGRILPRWRVITSRDDLQDGEASCVDLQYCDYDEIDWDAAERPGHLANSYILRKALIRKNYLCVAVSHRLAKHPDSVLANTFPKTYPFEIAHADELDELFYDELYELSEYLEQEAEQSGDGRHRWWILKPAMADKGQGIRLFDSKESLQAIFEDFEESSDEEEEDDAEAESAKAGNTTKVSLGSMRDWIIQEYVSRPLLMHPPGLSSVSSLPGRKFHLRVYVLAIGALKVYLYTDVLALFASEPYALPRSSTGREDDEIDLLAAHLTNTCLQTDESASSSVCMLSDLVDQPFYSPQGDTMGKLSHNQVDGILSRIGESVAETFQAGLGMSNHFSVTGNAFEVFGIDILLSQPDTSDGDIPIHLLEVNACPDFKQTGPRLRGVIEVLFEGVLDLAVKPAFEDYKGDDKDTWQVGQRRGHWLKCLEENVRPVSRPW